MNEFRLVREISFIIYVCLSVRMEQICYFNIFLSSVEEVQVLLKSYKNNWYFTWRPVHILNHILLIFSYNEKFFRQNL